ncbi:ABC transporter ATP-binding protein [Isachenkonia alkalipeptolytica]|uniref:ABC transporter ATP-binding protein n=1 Tax=Isachenkonia alkalipeptolytica TaxID=2565777 RepID=A0AA43XJT3_9CLOT|nr:ABC transporter ATP-binding protein [Isachenkonia alkalipeptolytica]NBG87489.1 ABC transporter ATP-binding protein [Isachenkonia alkalipeptolytica]
MIEVKGLTKGYEGFNAVKDLDLTVNKGSIYGLLGSNGAGKTTLLKTLAGLYRQDRGVVLIGGERVYENPEVKKRMVFISDALYFFPSYTIEEMGAFYRRMYGNWNEKRFRELQKVFKIDFKRKINGLSKGMNRQVGIWLGLSAMAEVMILDEPLDGLDSVMRKKVKNLLFQDVAERELTVIISSHNLRELEDLCDYVGILHRGKMVIERDMDDLKKDVHKVQFALRESNKDREITGLEVLHKEKKGSVDVWIIRGSHQAIENRFGEMDPAILDILPLTLEEVFIYEMGDQDYEIDQILLR